VGRDGIGVTDRETTPFSLASLDSVWQSGHEISGKTVTGGWEISKGVRHAWTYFWKCLISRTCWM
jgi:hypothetical protein